MFLQTFWKCIIYNSNFLCNFPVAPGFIIKSSHREMFCEKPVLINFSKIYQKTPAGKSFLGGVEAYRIFSNKRRASNGAPVSGPGLLVGSGSGCVWGCDRSRGVWCWLWCGMARSGFLGGFLVVVAGCSFLCVCVCVWWGLGAGLSFYGAWTLSCGASTLP